MAARVSETRFWSSIWVECAHHVAREIVYPFRKKGVHLIGFSGCYPNQYAFDMMSRLCCHPKHRWCAARFIWDARALTARGLAQLVAESGRPVETLVIQQRGGTLSTVDQGQEWLQQTMNELEETHDARENVGGRTGRGRDLRRL